MASRQARRRQQRVSQRGRPIRKSTRPWYLSPMGLGAVVVAGLIVVWIVVSQTSGGSPKNSGFQSKPASASLLAAITNPGQSTLASVGTGGLLSPWQPIVKPPKTMLTRSGKPTFFFWGGEFCPICAADRWSIINALSRFGHFSRVYTMKSTTNDVYPDTNTFTFRRSVYASKYIDFRPVEAENRDENPYPVPAWAQALVNRYNKPPYVSQQSAGGFPFIDLANRAIGGLPPNENEGNLHVDSSLTTAGEQSAPLSWQTIAAGLAVPTTPQAKMIFGNANWLTAGICKVTGEKPAGVCSVAPISQIERRLTFHP